MEGPIKLDLPSVKHEVLKAIHECSARGLLQSTKWLSEIYFSINKTKTDACLPNKPVVEPEEYDAYLLAKSYFDIKEYDRCAFYSMKCTSPCVTFLHMYSQYLSLEKKRVDNLQELFSGPDAKFSSKLQLMCTELRALHIKNNLDGYSMWLYGVILKRLDLLDEARSVLVESATLEPLHWGAWMELATLLTDRSKLRSLSLPIHWMKHFFLAHAQLGLQLNDEALEIYYELRKAGFDDSTYLLAQIAIAQHNKQEVNEAIGTFKKLRKIDPYRLDNMDTFSNLLFVREMKAELTYLAQYASEVDKNRVETCCVIGNFYSLRTEHQKAVVHFERALRLNPQYLSAWTLMGHEYMQMRNTSAAIQSYRHAIAIDRRDYRAWFGLGQTYEILRMLNYSLYYYKQAQLLRPNDSRMFIALGEIYEQLVMIQEAAKCFFKARNVGDIEGHATLKLAKVFDKLFNSDQAAHFFTEYIKKGDNLSNTDNKTEISYCYQYLAKYYFHKNQLETAYSYAQKCLYFEESKEEGQVLIRIISQKTSKEEEKEMQNS